MSSKVDTRYKFVLRKLSAFKKFEFIFLQNFNCFTYSQTKYIEKRLVEDGVITLVKKGGNWNDAGFFEKNIYKVNWDAWDLQYRGYLAAVEYVDLEKEYKDRVISAASNAKLAKDVDFVISSAVNRSIKGLSISDVEKVLEKRYWQHRMIVEIEKEVKDSMIVENRAKFKFTLKGSKLERISYRPTNSYVSLKKSDGSRDRFLETHGLKKLKHGDIKSEIPRVNCLIETGEWKDVDFDFYAEFCGDKSVRGEVKKWFMPMYMTHFKDAMTRAHRTASQFIHYKGVQSEDLKHMAFLFFEKISSKMEELMGTIHHSEIFIHTGAIEHLALLICCKLYPDGKFFQIYDEIFSTVEIDCMDEIYKAAALIYYNLLKNESRYIGQDSYIGPARFLSKLSVDSSCCRDDEVVDSSCCRDDVVVDEDVVVDRLQVVISHLISSLVSKTRGSKSSSSSSAIFETALKDTLYSILHKVFDYEGTDLKFKETVNAKNGRHGVVGRTWELNEDQKEKMRQPKSEETKEKMRQPKSEETKEKMKKPKSEETKEKMKKPKSEETKEKMKKPKSEETKEKIKNTREKSFVEMVNFASGLLSTKEYKALKKTREKTQFIDKKVQEKFKTLSMGTLKKIRKSLGAL